MCTQALGRLRGDWWHDVGRGYRAVGPVRTRAT